METGTDLQDPKERKHIRLSELERGDPLADSQQSAWEDFDQKNSGWS